MSAEIKLFCLFYLQQDGAPCQMAGPVMASLRSKCRRKLIKVWRCWMALQITRSHFIRLFHLGLYQKWGEEEKSSKLRWPQGEHSNWDKWIRKKKWDKSVRVGVLLATLIANREFFSIFFKSTRNQIVFPFFDWFGSKRGRSFGCKSIGKW